MTEHQSPHPGRPLLTAEAISVRVAELGAEISRDHPEGLLLVTVLKGAVFFLADLARSITAPVEMDFMAITSYQTRHAQAGATGHPAVRFLKDLDRPIEGRDVLIVEDVIDTGLTLHYIMRSLEARGPRSLEVCTLLDRPYRRLADVPVRYVGFTVPDDFFVGYGFDYRQRYRNLPYIAHISV